MNDHELAYERKRKDYTAFWKDFKKPLQDIHKELKKKNELHAQTNKILSKMVKEHREIWRALKNKEVFR